jgi:iron(II)-dependent oxidoreductase
MDFPYRENSAPWFGTSKVVKGGAWCTTALLAHATHRNFYDPGGRREVPTGFRVVKINNNTHSQQNKYYKKYK